MKNRMLERAVFHFTERQTRNRCCKGTRMTVLFKFGFFGAIFNPILFGCDVVIFWAAGRVYASWPYPASNEVS